MIEVSIESSDFLKIAETLTRMGILSHDKKKLTQSAHIFHSKSRYYIVSFKEMFAVEGKATNITDEDISRRNKIAKMLEKWGLVKIVENQDLKEKINVRVDVIPFKNKGSVELVKKYTIGRKKNAS